MTARPHIRKAAIGLVVTGALLAAMAALAWAAGTYLVRPAPTAVGPLPAGAEAIGFDSRSGARIRGWWFARDNARGSVVLMHGLRANRKAMMRRARLVNELGYAALVFDFQAHGESAGSVITFGHLESLDAVAAVDFARQRTADGSLFVIGMSMGGAAALLAEPALAVDGLVLEAVYLDITGAIANRLSMRLPFGRIATPLLSAQIELRLDIPVERLSPIAAAPRNRTPALLFAGTADRRTTADDTRRLARAFGGEQTLVWFERAAHVDLLEFDPILYRHEIAKFFERNRR